MAKGKVSELERNITANVKYIKQNMGTLGQKTPPSVDLLLRDVNRVPLNKRSKPEQKILFTRSITVVSEMKAVLGNLNAVVEQSGTAYKRMQNIGGGVMVATAGDFKGRRKR